MGTQKTLTELKESATFINAGWDVDEVWTIVEGESTPTLIKN